MTESTPTFDSTNLTIRLATEADYATVRELFSAGMVEGQVPGNDTGADIENLHEGYFADEGASAFWVASADDLVIGMIGVQRTRANTAEIRRLRVRAGYRRQGVGTALLNHAIDFCHRHSYLKVVLDVRIERGPAIAMFEKFGFALAHPEPESAPGYSGSFRAPTLEGVRHRKHAGVHRDTTFPWRGGTSTGMGFIGAREHRASRYPGSPFLFLPGPHAAERTGGDRPLPIASR
jgi:GNAT superfamily N-acetyltransferase